MVKVKDLTLTDEEIDFLHGLILDELQYMSEARDFIPTSLFTKKRAKKANKLNYLLLRLEKLKEK